MNRRSYGSHELTPEERSRGGLARALKLRERRATVERMKLEAMVNASTPRRRRNRATSSSSANVYGLRDRYAPAYGRPSCSADTRCTRPGCGR
jgi:hypothetical protein